MDNVQNSFFAKIVLFQKLIRLIFISLVSVPYLNSFTYDLGTLYSSVPGPNIIVTATPSNGGDVIVSVPIMIIEDPIFDPMIEDPIIEDPIFDPIPYMPSYSIAEVKATINEGFNFVHWKVNGQVIDGTQIGNEITLYLHYEQPDFTLDVVYENSDIYVEAVFVEDENYSDDLDGDLSDLFGKQLELKPTGRDSIKNHSIQMILNADGTSVYGIKNSIFENRDFTQINDNSFIWWERQLELEYEEDGSIILNAYFIPDANDGNQELVLDEIFSVTITDNSLQNYIDWEYQELFDSNEIDGKWSISRRLIDDISISQGNASFIFGEVDNLEPYEIETEMLYTRVIPETENWTAKLSDINILNGGANVELFVTSPDRTLDTGLYLYKNNVIRIDVFHYDDYSIYIEKGISDTRDLNFDISFDQNLQSIIYKYGKL